MSRKVFKIIIIFVIGTIGGIFADQILWPYFIERPLFYKYRLEQAPIHVTETNEIIIQENTALQDAFEKVEKAVVGIRTIIKKEKTIEGSGIVVTSDGLIVTLAELVPQDENSVLFIDNTAPIHQVLKRDLENNLALIKIEETNLPTIGFAEWGNLRFGQRVFLIGAVLENNGLEKIVNEGIIKTYNNKSIQTNITEKDNLNGSPLFNIEGQLIGLNTVDSKGKVSAIPVSKIQEFIGF